MPRTRKAPTPTMTKARVRLANCKSIDATLALTTDLSNATFETALTNAETELEKYNGILASADAQLNVFNAAEKILKDVNERMLEGVGVKYGKDSNEYEKAGDVRKSERKKPVKKLNPV